MKPKTSNFEVTLKLPTQIYNFYIALSDAENKPIQKLLAEKLITEVKAILDSEETTMKKVITQLLGLKKVLE